MSWNRILGANVDALCQCPPVVEENREASLDEGRVRVPAIVNWPGKIKLAVVNEPLAHVDFMPTLLEFAGGKGDPNKPFDG